ncbi:alpha-tocopherol transfer protein-like isoform X2 [Dreissena polymorpha]|uniref:alpha-tocopherol transfer protein-like isoform X2 n=1 Tax=Dreissena polymorpha TaxID=45954 RepID=UPI002263F772|nr:alpha-tocopherol transfer protein-like isoform X2 [Dreissena polymorpha]
MAEEQDDVTFLSTLDDVGKKKAKEELNELNDKDRALAVQSLRGWVLQQKWLRAPTDFGFLLRFLRARKFSQLAARQTLENYWKQKTKSPAWFRDVDPTDKTLIEIIKTGFYLIPRAKDKHGQRLIIERKGVLDMTHVKKVWGIDNVFKAICLMCDHLNRDETVQVYGLSVVIDNTDLTIGHFRTLLGQEYGQKIMDYYQNSLPARVKGIHLYNELALFDAVWSLVSPLLKQKTKDRMHLHGRNLTKLYDELGMDCLPTEYLPDDYDGPSPGNCQQIIDDMLSDLQSPEFCTYIKDLSSDKYGVDVDLLKQSDEPAASFRKLNVD